VFPGQAAVIS